MPARPALPRRDLRYTKWGGQPHRSFSVDALGEDEHGLWVVTDDKSVVTWGRRQPRPVPRDSLTLVPREPVSWMVTWTTDPGRRPPATMYTRNPAAPSNARRVLPVALQSRDHRRIDGAKH